MISFSELEFEGDNISEHAMMLAGCAGSVFGNMKEAKQREEAAKDNVKYVMGKLEREMHNRGSLPPSKGGGKDIKITVSSMKAYIDSHPDVVKARGERQQALADFENVKALCIAYNAQKALLEIRMRDKANEWYSEPTNKADNNKFDL